VEGGDALLRPEIRETHGEVRGPFEQPLHGGLKAGLCVLQRPDVVLGEHGRDGVVEPEGDHGILGVICLEDVDEDVDGPVEEAEAVAPSQGEARGDGGIELGQGEASHASLGEGVEDGGFEAEAGLGKEPQHVCARVPVPAGPSVALGRDPLGRARRDVEDRVGPATVRLVPLGDVIDSPHVIREGSEGLARGHVRDLGERRQAHAAARGAGERPEDGRLEAEAGRGVHRGGKAMRLLCPAEGADACGKGSEGEGRRLLRPEAGAPPSRCRGSPCLSEGRTRRASRYAPQG
jgi:hypothetical protein